MPYMATRFYTEKHVQETRGSRALRMTEVEVKPATFDKIT